MTDNTTPRVGILMGSDSDWPKIKDVATALDQFSVPFEVRVMSAHRTPGVVAEYASSAEQRGLQVVIAAAGGAAHLPGMIAALTTIPVIGVPVKSKSLNGVDSMYSILQMPGGIPVATVAIDGGLNAGLLAAQILAISEPLVRKKVEDYRNRMHDEVIRKDSNLFKRF